MEKKTIKSFKGFDKNLQCRGFQYEIGKSYEETDIAICEHGFHACENPLDVWDYYNMLDSRYCEVEQSGDIRKAEDDTKICSSKIKINAELKLADIINFGVEYIKDITSPKKIKGNSDKNDNSGDYAKIGSSDDNAQIGSSGDNAKIGSSGNFAQINSSGQDCVIMCAGVDSKAKAKKGSWITLAEWKYDRDKDLYIPTCVKTEQVDGKRIKEDTFYKLENGEFKEAEA